MKGHTMDTMTAAGAAIRERFIAQYGQDAFEAIASSHRERYSLLRPTERHVPLATYYHAPQNGAAWHAVNMARQNRG